MWYRFFFFLCPCLMHGTFFAAGGYFLRGGGRWQDDVWSYFCVSTRATMTLPPRCPQRFFRRAGGAAEGPNVVRGARNIVCASTFINVLSGANRGPTLWRKRGAHSLARTGGPLSGTNRGPGPLLLLAQLRRGPDQRCRDELRVLFLLGPLVVGRHIQLLFSPHGKEV